MKRPGIVLPMVLFSMFWVFPLPVSTSYAQSVDWAKRYNGPGNWEESPAAIAVDALGNVYVTGGSYGAGPDHYNSDYATIKYNADGKQLWVKRYNGPGNGEDSPRALAVDAQGNVYVTGASPGKGSSFDYATIKYSPSGKRLWVRRYNGPGNGHDAATALAVDLKGNVYVTGGSLGADSGYDFVTIKYSPSGERLWLRRYNRVGNGHDAATALAVDPKGNVYATGSTEENGVGEDYCNYATVKYSAGGKLLWAKTYNGPGNRHDAACAIGVDLQGNAYVTGGSAGADYIDYADYATIKYDPGGKQLWVRRYNGPGKDADQPHALVVDGEGNAYVTGDSVGAGTSHDYATVKYDPTGKRLWVRRYNGPLNDSENPSALALDAKGNVYVTGASSGKGSSSDYTTLKYSPSGERLWLKRYNNPEDGWDGARCIAVDADEHVYVTGSSFRVGSGNDYVTIKYNQ